MSEATGVTLGLTIKEIEREKFEEWQKILLSKVAKIFDLSEEELLTVAPRPFRFGDIVRLRSRSGWPDNSMHWIYLGSDVGIVVSSEGGVRDGNIVHDFDRSLSVLEVVSR